MSSHADRQRAYRVRQATGEVVLAIPVDFNALAAAFIDAGRISERDALSRERVEAAVAALVVDFTDRWRAP